MTDRTWEAAIKPLSDGTYRLVHLDEDGTREYIMVTGVRRYCGVDYGDKIGVLSWELGKCSQAD
jgi:hypothetical protein